MRPRRRFTADPPRPPRNEALNENIRASRVRLIGEDGGQLGIKTKERIMDHGKYRYEQEQKAKLARKHQSQVNVKEIKFRPKIGIHDYNTKKGHVERFLNQRAKVKVTIMFRGRETTHPERGRDLLTRLAEDVKEIGQVEQQPLLDGRNMTMLLGPTKNAGVTQTDAEDQETERSEEAVQGDRNGQADAPAGNEEPLPREEVG
ncbi:MAG: translation initiation factor IF-3 [Actinobacteria bacterium]|nr:MAG: translation initiation factor IF-3 [Actinomycetota bacterium]